MSSTLFCGCPSGLSCVAHADHAAVALPVEETAPAWARTLFDRTRYPQDAVLEAVLHYVSESTDTGD